MGDDMFVSQRKYDEVIGDAKNYMLEQMVIENRLQRRLDEAYRFAQTCCDEIFKHTGKHDFHERLDKIIRD